MNHPDAVPPVADEPKRRIILIDDDPLIRQLVVRALADEYEMVEAASGLEGIAEALIRPPDLILLDVMMPGELDGLQVCARVRALPALKATP